MKDLKAKFKGIRTAQTEIKANEQRIEALETENKVDKGRIEALEAKIKGNTKPKLVNTLKREPIRGALINELDEKA